MENLISGMPQAVNDGAAIVGLSAWHLYPNMIVYGGAKTIEINMDDELVAAGGVLTLGFSNSSTKISHHGVHWCLSLSSLNYYGPPVRSERKLDSDPKRISISQFQLAVLGTVLGTWKTSPENTAPYVKLLYRISLLLQKDFAFRKKDMWIDMLTIPASAYLNANVEADALASRLIDLGRRRAPSFIPTFRNRPETRPLFGLLDIITLLSLFKRHRVPDQTSTSLMKYQPIITSSYLPEQIATSNDMGIDEPVSQGSLTDSVHSTQYYVPIYATAFPNSPPAMNSGPSVGDADRRNRRGRKQCHHRWLPADAGLSSSSMLRNDEFYQYGSATFEDNTMTVVSQGRKLEFLFGHTKLAAVFAERNSVSENYFKDPPSVTLDDLAWCLESGILTAFKLESHLTNLEGPIFRTLSILAMASKIYESLPAATVNIQVLSQSFVESKGGGNLFPMATMPSYCNYEISREAAIAMIIYLETGLNVDISQLKDVVAISVGDSIYVLKKLVCDPFEAPLEYELHRIHGNIGKPGVVMLLPPELGLMVREIDLSRWRVFTPSKFDGQAEDCFSGTSLHLSFTKYHVPFFQNKSRGQQDASISMLESVISIRDSGAWVADVDIMKAAKQGSIYLLAHQQSCNHAKHEAPVKEMTSVGCWDDTLDYPDGSFVVKATGNWAARLAIASVLSMLPKRPAQKIVVCPKNVCWKCVMQEEGACIYLY
ncbi:hypothetical protein ACMFMG_007925 [Clarireedia jacksonii]